MENANVFSFIVNITSDILWNFELAFDEKFGTGLWEVYVEPYTTYPALLWSAPNNVYIGWLLNTILEYVGSPTRIDLLSPEKETSVCPGCSRLFQTSALFSLAYHESDKMCAECNVTLIE